MGAAKSLVWKFKVRVFVPPSLGAAWSAATQWISVSGAIPSSMSFVCLYRAIPGSSWLVRMMKFRTCLQRFRLGWRPFERALAGPRHKSSPLFSDFSRRRVRRRPFPFFPISVHSAMKGSRHRRVSGPIVETCIRRRASNSVAQVQSSTTFCSRPLRKMKMSRLSLISPRRCRSRKVSLSPPTPCHCLHGCRDEPKMPHHAMSRASLLPACVA